MDLWDAVDECEVAIEIENVNKYLTDKNEAMDLVSRILSFNKDNEKLKKGIFKLDKLIEEDLLNLMCKVNMQGETDAYLDLKDIKNKLYELNMIKLLNNKTIVGIGGMFSAGKSKFINSIIDYDILPENQLPTTSIPTYIAKGSNKLSAYTFTNLNVELDDDAINAISHVFYDEYKISFTNFIKSIVIENENYIYDNIVLLDTPGYTKAESHKKEDNTDESVAREHLKVCDYLIWLMDIENGVVINDDLNFIDNLKLDKPVLFVFNKADKKCEDDIKKILDNTKNILKEKSINVYGIAAYSSIQKKEYYSSTIANFFNEVKENNKNENNLDCLAISKLEVYEKYFTSKESELLDKKKLISNSISESKDLHQILSLGDIYSQISKELSINEDRKQEFYNIKNEIIKEFTKILKK
ncbi:MAG: dynamin family protein [Peptostreptococcaceae bacterium]